MLHVLTTAGHQILPTTKYQTTTVDTKGQTHYQTTAVDTES